MANSTQMFRVLYVCIPVRPADCSHLHHHCRSVSQDMFVLLFIPINTHFYGLHTDVDLRKISYLCHF